MARHFLRLYALVVLAIGCVSWGQEQLWLAYGNQKPANDKSLTAALAVIERQLQAIPPIARDDFVTKLSGDTGLDVQLFGPTDIAGEATLAKLRQGEVAYLRTGRGASWLLKQLDEQSVLALQYEEQQSQRGALEWLLALLFYAAIALVIMLWLWPLTRDLRRLEKATSSFGDRNWLYRADIRPRSQIYPLAETFRKMAARIDTLIGSHKDMSNAVSHEIKTPLSRMQFELEAAQRSPDPEQLQVHLLNIKSDIADLNALVAATLNYAILERADLALNFASQDFTQIVPAVTDYVRRDAQSSVRFVCDVQPDATHVVCDVHLLETALRNLLYNASRYARSEIRVAFKTDNGQHRLVVDDDGPGIPAAERERVFGSFVQLDPKAGGRKTGFGLGLAIVKRVLEWHGGSVEALPAPTGGARFVAQWPATLQSRST